LDKQGLNFMTALVASQLSKSFGSVCALDGLELSIDRACFFGLLGPNGAGKSTFMNIASGFLKPDGGGLEIFGAPLTSLNQEQKKLIGFAPQHLALYKELSAETNLSLFGKLYGLSGKRLSERVDYALELAQLSERRKSLVKGFSGGMQRRLNIAVALLHQPKILLCDEPTVGVDPQSRNAIFNTLSTLRDSGLTVVYSTHYMEEAERLCDKVAIIDGGKILRYGELDLLLRELPATINIKIKPHYLEGGSIAELARFGEIENKNGELLLHPNKSFLLSHFYAWVESKKFDASKFSLSRPSLESLFLMLTGRELRE